jgi:hypothetical protein
MHLPTLFRRLVVIGTPLVLGALEIFHPMPGENFIADLHPHVGWWLILHVLQLPLFGLMALAVATLLSQAQARGVAAGVSRIALGGFAVFYIAFDSLAGVAAGLVAAYASALPVDQQDALLPLIIDLNFSPLALGINALGALGWVTAVIAAAIALWQRGVARDPAILLGLSAIFALHTPPTGPLGLLFFALAAAWIEFAARLRARSQPVSLMNFDDQVR